VKDGVASGISSVNVPGMWMNYLTTWGTTAAPSGVSIHAELAAIKINGQSAGIAWKPPFRLEVSSLLKAGENQLEIQVINLWPNRIIGDLSLPAEKRLTHTTAAEHFRADSPLLPSGLLGPVMLHMAERLEIR